MSLLKSPPSQFLAPLTRSLMLCLSPHSVIRDAVVPGNHILGKFSVTPRGTLLGCRPSRYTVLANKSLLIFLGTYKPSLHGVPFGVILGISFLYQPSDPTIWVSSIFPLQLGDGQLLALFVLLCYLQGYLRVLGLCLAVT